MVAGEEDNSMLLESDAKIAMADEVRRLRLFEKVIAQQKPTARTLRLTARALELNGQMGLAEQRLQDAIEAYPSDLRNHLQLAELYGRNNEPGKGMAVFEQLPRSVIERNSILANAFNSMAVMQAKGQGIPENISDPVLIALAKADEAIENGDTSAAQQILLDQLAQDEEELRVLVGLAHAYSLGGSTDKAQGHRQGCRASAKQRAAQASSSQIRRSD